MVYWSSRLNALKIFLEIHKYLCYRHLTKYLQLNIEISTSEINFGIVSNNIFNLLIGDGKLSTPVAVPPTNKIQQIIDKC